MVKASKIKPIWGNVIPILLLVLLEMSTKLHSLKISDLGIYIVYYVFDIAYFYLVTLGYMPFIIGLFRNNRFVQQLFAAMAVPFYGILILLYSALYTLLLNGKATFFLDFETLQRSSMRGILISALAYAVAYARAKIIADQKTLQLENNLLHLQTDPHLINNVLGYVCERIEEYSKEDAKAIVLLSELTSDGLNKSDVAGKILLKDEIAYIRKYLILEALYREKEPFNRIVVHIEGYEDLLIPPKLLLDPVVNLLKYADLNDIVDPAMIEIKIQDSILYMETYNRKGQRKPNSSNQIGINNLQKRLDLNYRNKHVLKIEDHAFTHRLSLAIELC
ncbi:sensor histidine kinase [Sphingobacterium siyangense]|uniref:sensor histidine kinase n=1 Tax=Sphingobacterium siyangense TaxID=459529 RepID=UPI003DA29D14